RRPRRDASHALRVGSRGADAGQVGGRCAQSGRRGEKGRTAAPLSLRSRLMVSASSTADRELVSRLLRRDEDAFRELVRIHDAGLRRMARLYVADPAADDVVQDTWLTVIRGIGGFQGRSSLKTWIYGILVNVARRRAQREGRTVPFSATAR